jgi:spore germination cell wall hydrolase CwlJ-like protein
MQVRILFTLFIVIYILGFSAELAKANIQTPNMPFKAYYSNLTAETKNQIKCLAENIYFEAAHEPKEGKIAVAFVTLNRVKSKYFKNDICGVVKQKIGGVCQFSWYCEKKPKAMLYDEVLTNNGDALYNDIVKTAIYVFANYERLDDPTKGALFYHANYVNPGWKNMEKTAVIGKHIFYIRKDLKGA